jgi:hypothetical protein
VPKFTRIDITITNQILYYQYEIGTICQTLQISHAHAQTSDRSDTWTSPLHLVTLQLAS